MNSSPDRLEATFSEAEIAAMRTACEAALRGPRGANPLVGAAIIDDDGTLLHVGLHRGAGSAHAEVDAIQQAQRAGTDLSRTTMLVTLEPCDHEGRTGPCTRTIVTSGIPRVVYAVADPTGAGGGGAHLRRQATRVRSGLLGQEATALNHRWFAAQRASRPFVTIKTAQTLDGRIAALDGTSQWITGEASRHHAHGVRARVDAVVVGTGTVLADDPRLTVRLPDRQVCEEVTDQVAERPGPLRVAVGHRDIPESARMRGTDGRFRHLRTHDPREVLTALYDEGVRHVLVEGGPSVTGAFLGADLADELMVYQAPVVLGSGSAAIPDLGVHTLAQAHRYVPDNSDGGPVRTLGEDLWWHLQPAPGNDQTSSHKES